MRCSLPGAMAGGEVAASEDAQAAADAGAAEGEAGGGGGGYDSKCVFCRIGRREEPGTALLPCQVRGDGSGSGRGRGAGDAGAASPTAKSPRASVCLTQPGQALNRERSYWKLNMIVFAGKLRYAENTCKV